MQTFSPFRNETNCRENQMMPMNISSCTIGTMVNVSSKTKSPYKCLSRIKHYITHVFFPARKYLKWNCCIFGRRSLFTGHHGCLRINSHSNTTKRNATITILNNEHWKRTKWTRRTTDNDSIFAVQTNITRENIFAQQRKELSAAIVGNCLRNLFYLHLLLVINNKLLVLRKRQFKHFQIEWAHSYQPIHLMMTAFIAVNLFCFV